MVDRSREATQASRGDAAVVLYLPSEQASLDYRAYEENVSGRSLLHWFRERVCGPDELVVLCHGVSESERVRGLIERDHVAAAVFEASQPIRTDAYLELAKTSRWEMLVFCDLGCLLALPDHVPSLLIEHRAHGATVTTIPGLPDFLSPIVVSTALLQGIDELGMPTLPPDPRLMIRLLVEAEAEKEFGLPLNYVLVRTNASASAEACDPPHHADLSTRVEVEALRRAVENESENWETVEGAAPLLARWRDTLVALTTSRQTDERAAWRSRSGMTLTASTPMRVLYASAPSGFSGAEASLCALVKAIGPTRIEAHALVSLSGEFTRRLQAAGTIVHCPEDDFSQNSVTNLYFCLNLLSELRPALVHANALVGSPLVSAAASLGIPLVQHVRVPYPDHLRYELQAAARVIVVSKFLVRRVVRLGVPNERIDVVYNGVDPEYFDRGCAREVIGKSEADARVVTMVARGTRQKRHDVFIKALGEVRRRSSVPVRAIVITEAWEDGRYYQDVMNLIKHEGVNDILTVMGFQKDIRALLAETDILVLCSDDDSLARCVLEAMAMEVPVVVTHSGGSPEIVGETGCGILVEPGNSSQVADAILRLVHDDSARRDMGVAGRERVLSAFSARVCAENTMRAYDRVSSLPARPQPEVLLPSSQIDQEGAVLTEIDRSVPIASTTSTTES